MRLQQEANAHINRKRKKFQNEFNDLMKPLQKLLQDNLHTNLELENALLHLVETELWTKRCVEIHGIKS